MLASRLVVMVLFAALLSVAPFQAALAQTALDLGTADSFAVLGGTAVTLTNSAIIGDVGSPVAVTLTTSTVVGTVYPPGDPIAIAAYNDFLAAYNLLGDMGQEQYACTGYLNTAYTGETITLTPGVYCNDAAVTFTSTTLTLDAENDPNAIWIFKIGTAGTGALTGTSLSVVMANGGLPCNVYWWVAQGVTMTTSNFKGNILAGAAITFTTNGGLIGRAMAKAGVTMTGLDVFGCSSISELLPDDDDSCSDFCNDFCKKFCKEFSKHPCDNHDKDCKKHHDKDCKKDNDDNNHHKGNNHDCRDGCR